MIIALIDNGSLEAAAHRNLRSVAAALSEQTGCMVRAVSWKHSDRIALDALDQTPAWTLDSFIRSFFALGQRDFLFIPFFVSEQGAIGSALRTDIENLQRELGGFEFNFTEGLARRGAIPVIVAARIRETIAVHHLRPPRVIVVDHGGPSAVSAALRDQLAHGIRRELGSEIEQLAAASMEGAHPPLLADLLKSPDFVQCEIVIAPLFLSPGRHAGLEGDLARICQAAETRCHFTGLVGTHPHVVEVFQSALHDSLSLLHAQPFA